MNNHRYILQKYAGRTSRFTCPKCEKNHQFTRYIDQETNTYLSNEVGICNRIDECGYHFTPKQYSDKNGLMTPYFINRPRIESAPQPISFIDDKIFKETLAAFDENCFIQYLHSIFDTKTVNILIQEYHIGTSKVWKGGTTIFWQVDRKSGIRTGKLIKYDSVTGKRLKVPFIHTNWVHSILKLKDFNLKQCFFGIHLIDIYPNKTIGIVESEKTAIIASVYFPEIVWIASGGADGINKEKVKDLVGRKVILFPDTSNESKILKKWEQKANEFGFELSSFTEEYAIDQKLKPGLDIADLIIHEKASKTKSQVKYINKFEIEDYHYPILYDIPYLQPSPARIIDMSLAIETEFTKNELVITSRVFFDIEKNEIEIIGVRDYGKCGTSSHKWKEICSFCMFNTTYLIKINSILQERKYSHQELLLKQNK